EPGVLTHELRRSRCVDHEFPHQHTVELSLQAQPLDVRLIDRAPSGTRASQYQHSEIRRTELRDLDIGESPETRSHRHGVALLQHAINTLQFSLERLLGTSHGWGKSPRPVGRSDVVDLHQME